MRRSTLALVSAVALAGCGGSDHRSVSSTRTSASPTRTSSDSDIGKFKPGTATVTIPARPRTATNAHAPGTAPHTTASASGPALSARQAREARRVRAPATFTFRSGSISPRTITVPAFIAVQLSIVSADGKPHAARLTTPRGAYRLRVAPGARASVLVAGMRAGRYPMTAGSQHATLVTGGEPGP